MKIAIISFTDKGDLKNREIAGFFTEDEVISSLKKERKETLSEWSLANFNSNDALIFVGAAGIAVRAVAPLIRKKDTDPAVIVCDELGKFVIPILSGHIGGANELAGYLAERMGATAVITTATDINKVWAVDSWAKKKGYYIWPVSKIKDISGSLLKGQQVGITSPLFSDIKEIFDNDIPEGLSFNNEKLPNGISVSPYKNDMYENTIHLIPKCITIGAGSKKDAAENALCELVDRLFEENGIFKQAVKEIATIDIKKEEKSILKLGEYLGVPVRFFSAEELNAVEGDFEASEFVKSITGTDNVCERSTIRAMDGGRIIIPKTKGVGVTVSVGLNIP